MSQYAFIVSADMRYLPETAALLNSLDWVGHKEDVYLLHYRLPDFFIQQLNKLDYKVIAHEASSEDVQKFGCGDIMQRKRYYYAAEWGERYDAICLLDADMFFNRTVTQYLAIAAKTGFICGASLEQKRIYGGENPHHFARGKPLLEKEVWAAADVCCAPLFLDAKKYKDYLRECWLVYQDGHPDNHFKGPDMDIQNILTITQNLTDQIVILPNLSWVGTNEKMLKPYTFVRTLVDDRLWCDNGEPIYIVHGQYYKRKWRQTQVDNRHRCAESYLGCSERSDGMAEQAMNTIYNRFKKMLDWKIRVPKVAYSEDGESE